MVMVDLFQERETSPSHAVHIDWGSCRACLLTFLAWTDQVRCSSNKIQSSRGITRVGVLDSLLPPDCPEFGIPRHNKSDDSELPTETICKSLLTWSSRAKTDPTKLSSRWRTNSFPS
ncbi:hypothetical protein F2P56_021702 [Juglans regia]|uniref:Uncharacterized protein n=1 Tax=Juglans regia TaxID=51240 RepID=A0A833X325_JUGRE|nr:hypothetical protein F2P56_021702 [Juglans regia]